MGFWKTLIRVCSGRDVFLQLLDRGFGRALLHLVILILLLAFCLAWGHSCRFSPQLRRMTGSLFGEIGSIRFISDKGIRTGKQPDVKQSYLLDLDIRFDYFPGQTLTEADLAAWKGRGLVVMDKGMAVWLEDPAGKGNGEYWIMPVPLDRGTAAPAGNASQNGMTRAGLFDYLKKNFELAPGQHLQFALADATEQVIADYLVTAFGVCAFFASLFVMVTVAGVTIVFFGFMQLVMSAFVGPKLSLRQILVMLIYIAFPALLIAALYSFFMIPQVLPQMVFFAVYLLYYLAVFRKIRLTLNPPAPEMPDDF